MVMLEALSDRYNMSMKMHSLHIYVHLLTNKAQLGRDKNAEMVGV